MVAGTGDYGHAHKCGRAYCNCRCHDILGAALSNKLPGPPALVLEPPDCGEGTEDTRSHKWDLAEEWMGQRDATKVLLEFFGISALHTCRRCLARRLQLDTMPEGLAATMPDGGTCYMRMDDWAVWWMPLLHGVLAGDFWHAAPKMHKDSKAAPARRQDEVQPQAPPAAASARRQPAFTSDHPMPASWFTTPPKQPARASPRA